MPVTGDRPAPYAPASAILGLVNRHRTRGLPSYDAEVLARAGVSESLIPRTLQAMQTLDLIGEDGKPTPILEGLRLAPEAEFKARLGEWLTEAYADALSYVDPAKDDEIRIRDAFRGYQPVGQQPRMVTLFMGLFAAAGIGPDKVRSSDKPKPKAAVPRNTPPMQRKQSGSLYGTIARAAQMAGPPPASNLPPAMSGLLASLPASGNSWGKQERDRFLHTFEAVLDFCFPVARHTEEQPPAQERDEDVSE